MLFHLQKNFRRVRIIEKAIGSTYIGYNKSEPFRNLIYNTNISVIKIGFLCIEFRIFTEVYLSSKSITWENTRWEKIKGVFITDSIKWVMKNKAHQVFSEVHILLYVWIIKKFNVPK